MQFVAARPNGHGKDAAPDNETRHARFPLPEGAGDKDSLREFHDKERTQRSAMPHPPVVAVSTVELLYIF